MSTIVDLRVRLNEQGKTVAGLRTIAKEAEKVAATSAKMAERMAERTVAAERYTLQATERFSQARAQLGIRAEKDVQREIQQTQQAYKLLANSGIASAKELARAKDAELRKVRELNAELGKGQKLQKALTIGAGVVGGAYLLKNSASQAMSFDERLAGMANTAFAERGVNGRKVGMKELEAVINRSTQLGIGGGTREQAAEALDAMIAKNVLGFSRSMQFLPTVMKTASGASAAPVDIANLSSVLVGQGVVSNDKELRTALNMITASGQAGGFEIKDMAKWLAQQMPTAKRSGLIGLNGLQKVLTMNQAAILTSGTTDEAGNNVVNLLAKLNSSDTANDFKKQGRGDLAQFLMSQRAKGVDSVAAWMNLLDKESSSNPQIKAALAQLKVVKDKSQQKEIIDSIAAMSEGSVIGKYFQDRQALGALLGMRNKPIVDTVNAAISKNRTEFGVNDTNYALMSSTASAQVRAAAQAKDAGTKAAMDGLTPTIGKLATAFADLATKHPLLAGASTLAAAALTAVAGAASLASIGLGGKGAGVGLLAGVGRVAPKLFGRAGVLGGAAYVGGAGLDYAFGSNSAASSYGSAALNGAAMGGLAGSFIPVVGTGIGAAIGGAGGLLSAYLNSPSNQTPAKVDSQLTVGLAPGLVITKQTTNSSNNINSVVKVGNLNGNIWGIP